MKKHSSALPKYKNKSSSYSLRLALESRLVFDGAMIATAVEVQQETAVDSPVTVNTSEAAPPPSEPNVDFVPEATPDAVAYQPNAVEESHQPAFAIDPALPESSNLPNLNAGLSDLNPSTPSIVEPRSAAGLSLLSDSPANTAIATLNPTPENFQQRSEPLHEQHDLVDTTANGILLEAPAAETPHELVFVDARVKDLQSFLSERASEIILLDPDRDGVEQIAAALAGRTGVDVIHILSHGDAGQLYLGNSTLDVHSISGKHTDELANIKAALSNNADILVYGCDVAAGAQGQAFVTALAAATGADVAASIDLTGNADLGGDWQLEASTGNIEAKTLAFTDYQGLLDAPTITDSIITTRTTPEDTNLNITGIAIADVDGDNQFVALSTPDGVITLTAGSGVAGLAGEGTGAVTFNGTLAQVNAAINGIIFTPAANYSGAASVTLTTNDGATTAVSTINITVLPVNDAPVATPDLIAITEDVNSVTGNVLTNDTDPDSPDTKVVQGVAPGTIAGPLTGGYNNPIAGDYGTFTLNSDGTYNYILDNSKPAVQELAAGQTVTDIFTYTMKDSAGVTSTESITVTVTGANDAPLVDVSATLKMPVTPENATGAENTGVLISSLLVDVAGRALATDVDAGTHLGISIDSDSISNGMAGHWEIQPNGSISWTTLAVPATLFYDTKIRFVADTNVDDTKESGTASLHYRAWDGIASSSTALSADFAVASRNDAPTLSPVTLTLNETNAGFINSVHLPLVDPDNTNLQILYRLEGLPANGTLFKNGVALTVGTLFSQADVAAGNVISYQYSGPELSANSSDSFTFSVRDGAGGVLGANGGAVGDTTPRTFNITVNDVNAQIAITGTSQSINELVVTGDYTNLNLNMSDPDGDPALMKLTIDTLPDPVVGKLQYWDGSAFVDVIAGLQLTQAQLNANPLRFISTGVEPSTHPAATFTVSASDNHPTLAPTTATSAVTINIMAANDAPTPVTTTLTILQGGSGTIGNTSFAGHEATLTATDPDSPAANRVYTISDLPAHGILKINGIEAGLGSSFTEADLTAGLLRYTNDGFSTASDNFRFSVNDRDGGISSGTLHITIDTGTTTVLPPEGTLKAQPAEDGILALNNITLRGSGSYILVALPTHGALYLNGTALGVSDTFTQMQIDAGNVVYVNDGNEPTYPLRADPFTVTRSGGGLTGDSIVTLTVSANNDAPTISQTTSAINTNVDGGFLLEANTAGGDATSFTLTNVSNAAKLTAGNLQWNDSDTSVAQLDYVVDAAPAGGTLNRWNGSSWVILGAGSRFTATDVTAGNIAYFHAPASELRNDSISVYLADGGVVQVGDVQITVGAGVSELDTQSVNDGTTTINIAKGAATRSPSRTISFTIANVNDAPVATNGRFDVDEGKSNVDNVSIPNNPGRIQVLNSSIMGVTDSDNPLADLTYRIAGLPTCGTLEIDRGSGYVALIVADIGTTAAELTLADLNTGKLRYVQDGSEHLNDNFTFAAKDMEPLDSNIATVNINIRPINDPPVINNNTPITVNEGSTGNVITANFLGATAPGTLVDPDNAPAQVQYRLSAAVNHGQLYLDNGGVKTVLGVGSAFTLQDVIDGKLKYTHDGSEPDFSVPSVDDSYNFILSDSSGMNEPAGTFKIHVNPVNDAPTLGGMGGKLVYVEDSAAAIIDGLVSLTDTDLANNGSNFNTGTLTISLSDGLSHVADQLSIRNQGTGPGQIGFNSGTGEISYGGIVFGVVSGVDNGANGANLRITLDADANIDAVKSLIQNITFRNTDTANPVAGTRMAQFTLNDGGGTDSGGNNTASGTASISVSRANDAPVLNAALPNLGSFSEDIADPYVVTTVAAMVDTSISDVDVLPSQGIAITGLNSGNGIWQYNTGSGWNAIGTVSDVDALLLRPSDSIRFIPDGKNATTANVSYRAWDQTTGSAGTKVDTTATHVAVPADTSAFSVNHDTATLTITAVNDAPLLVDTVLALNQFEDAATPVGPVGTLVSSLVGGVSDVDTGAVNGIAITAADSTQGIWYFTTDGGTNWKPLGIPTVSSAVLLSSDANTRVYFQPNANYNGVQGSALTLRAWDQSTGNNGDDHVDTTINGGTTAFSTTTDTISLTVTALNDAPAIANTAPTIDTASANENTRITLGSVFTLGDNDLARFEGTNQGQITLSVPHGAFVLDTTGVTVTAGTQATDRGAGDWGGGTNSLTFTGTLAQLQTALSTVNYVPGDNPDTSETITVTLDDLNNAGLGSSSGGSDIHSVNTTVTINNIQPVNDAPTLIRPANVTAIEDVQFSFNGVNTISIADVDARNGTVEITLSIPKGSLTLTQGATTVTSGALNSATFTLQGSVFDINTALTTLKYSSALDDNSLNASVADRTLSINVSDLGNSIGGAITSAGTVSATTIININAVNDTPTLDVDSAAGVQTTRTATTVSENATTAIIDIVLADFKDINDSGYGSNTNIVITALHGTLSLDPSIGITATASDSPTGRTLTLTGTIANINAAILASSFKYTPDTNFSGNDTLGLVFHDAGNSGSGGDKTASASIPIQVGGLNDTPVFSGLGGGSVGSPDVGFTEDGVAVALDVNATISDPELSSYNNWGSAVLTVQRTATTGNTGGAGDDVFTLTGSGDSGVNFKGSNIRIGTAVVGIYTNAGGVLAITFNNATTTTQVNQVLQAIKYSNTNNNPPTTVTLGCTINDGNTNTGLTAQGGANPTLALTGNGQVIVGITANNDTPVLSGISATASITEDATAITLAGSALASDPELSFFGSGTGDWGGATLNLSRISPNTDDRYAASGTLSTLNQGGSLILNGVTIGTVTTNSGGTLKFTFSAGTTTDQVRDAMRQIVYSNSRQSLTTSETESVALVWTLNDGNAALNGAQGLGGAKQTTFTETVTLTGANDAPILTDTLLNLTQNEDAIAPSGAVGTLVSALTGGITDIDTSNPKGIAITTSDSSLGTWFYSINGGSNWIVFGAVSETGSLLLRPTDRVYFQPNANINGEAATGITFRAWDQSTDSAGSKADASVNGGTSAFSTATDTISLTIIAVNDAPTRLLSSVPLAASPEDALSPSQATVANLFNGVGSNAAFSDATDQVLVPGGSLANNFAGVVIVKNTANALTEGVWQYSADGTAWTTVTNSVTTNAGVFITPSYQLRFVPAANYNGTPPGLTVRLVDDAAVTPALPVPGATNVDVTISGGTTRYSNNDNAVTLTTNITAVNDAPIANNDRGAATEDTTLTVTAANGLITSALTADGIDSDIDNASLSITTFTLAGDATVYNAGDIATLPGGAGTLQINPDGSYVFTPALNYTGLVPVATYTLSDGALNDTATLTIAITPINDAPVADNENVTTPEDTPIVIDVLAGDTDVDGTLNPATVQIGGTAGPGLALVVAGQGTWSVNTGTGAITFTPELNYNGTPTPITYTVKDNLGLVSNAATVSVTVTPVDDPLTITNLNDGTVTGTDGTVREGNLANGTTPTGTNETSSGTFNISAPDGIDSLQIGTTTLTLAQLMGSGATPQTIVSPQGTLVINGFNAATGTVNYSYTLTSPDNTGTDAKDTFILTLTDVQGGNTTTANLAILIIDDAPIARNDADEVINLGGNPSSIATGNVLTGMDAGLPTDDPNKTDGISDSLGADGPSAPVITGVAGKNPLAPLPVAGTVAGAFGTLTLATDGSYTYVPDYANPMISGLPPNGSQIDTFTYEITDSDGDKSTATLTITIVGTPAIIGLGDGAVAGTDGSVMESDLASGTNPVGLGETLSGTFQAITPNGLQSLNVGGTSISEADLLTSGTTPLVITTANGTLIINGYNAPTGVVNYTYTLTTPANSPARPSDNIAIFVIDDAGNSTASAAKFLKIAIIDDAPIAANDIDSVTENSGLPATGNVFTGMEAGGDTNASDGVADQIGADANSNPVSAFMAGVTGTPTGVIGFGIAGHYGTLTLHADGNYSYLLDNTNATVNALPIGGSLNDVFTYQITDADGSKSTATLTITIAGANDAPVAVNDTAPTVITGTHPSINVLANDSDAEDGKPTIIDLDPASPGIQNSFTNADGTFTAAGGVVTFTPTHPGFTGSTRIDYVAIDSAGAVSNVGVVSFNIIARNTSPVAVNDTALPVTVGNNPSINVLANDTDAEDGKPILVDLDPAKPGIQNSFTNADGTFTAAGGVVTFTPGNRAFTGRTTLDYVAIDSAGAISNVGVIGFSITPAPNTAPVAVNDIATPVTVGSTSLNYVAVDSAGAVSNVAVVNFIFNGESLNNGSLIALTNPTPPLFPPFQDGDTYPLMKYGDSRLILQNDDLYQPVHFNFYGDELYLIGSLRNQVVLEERSYSFDIPRGAFQHSNPSEKLEFQATRPDGSPLPKWLKFDPNKLKFSGVPPKGALATQVMVTAKDSHGNEVQAYFNVIVNKEPNHSSQSHLTLDVELPQAANEPIAENDGHNKFDKASGGKAGLTEQIHAAGKLSRLQESQALLNSLKQL